MLPPISALLKSLLVSLPSSAMFPLERTGPPSHRIGPNASLMLSMDFLIPESNQHNELYISSPLVWRGLKRNICSWCRECHAYQSSKIHTFSQLSTALHAGLRPYQWRTLRLSHVSELLSATELLGLGSLMTSLLTVDLSSPHTSGLPSTSSRHLSFHHYSLSPLS